MAGGWLKLCSGINNFIALTVFTFGPLDTFFFLQWSIGSAFVQMTEKEPHSKKKKSGEGKPGHWYFS